MRRDPTEFRKRFAEWKETGEYSLPRFEDGYETFFNTLPENQKRGLYPTRRYWELNGKPKNFAEAVGKGMYTLENDNGILNWHAGSVAYNKNTDQYEFMKANYHPTRWMELVYGYDQSPEFLKEWKVLYNGPMLSDRYVRREKPGLKTKGGQLPKFYLGTEGDDIEALIKKRLESKSDATTVKRQEPVLPIKREYGKIVDPKLVERKQLQQPTIKRGSTYKVKPRPQTFAGRVTLAAGGDWIKADMTSAGISQIPIIGTLNGALDFGYDLNNSTHNALDLEANTNTAMSGLALFPYLRNGLKMLKGKTFVDRLRNAYELAMTKYNTSKEVNKALKTAKRADAIQDGTAGIMDLYAKDWFNNKTTFFKPYTSHGSTGNTVGDVIDFNLGMYGGRDKLISELTPNQQWSLIKAVTTAEGNISPRMRKIIHMDDSGPQPVNKIGLVPKDATNSNSSWTSSLVGEPEIWWNRAEPYYSPFGYSSIKSIPRTYVADMDNLINSGITLEGKKVLHGPGVVPFEAIDYAIQPNPFGWFDLIKFK